MSRIGKVPINVPKGVDVKIDRNEILVKGPKGQLNFTVPTRVTIDREDGAILVRRNGDDKSARAYHGLAQRIIRNMVIGVTDGFTKELEIQGVGYRAAMDGNKLSLQLGFSHPILFDPPPGVKIEVPKPTTVLISGYDKQQVGQVAAIVRGYRPPEPYKGKGVRYAGEKVRRKVGKTGAK